MSRKKKAGHEDVMEAEAIAGLEKFSALTEPPEEDVAELIRQAVPAQINTEEDVADAYIGVGRLILEEKVSARSAIAAAPYFKAGMDTHLQRIRRKLDLPEPHMMMPPPPPMRTMTLQVTEPLGRIPDRLSGQEPAQLLVPAVTPPPFGK